MIVRGALTVNEGALGLCPKHYAFGQGTIHAPVMNIKGMGSESLKTLRGSMPAKPKSKVFEFDKKRL
ncbi:MAG: hypothetical protein ACO20W_05445 [Anaerohalosphaeraceae bacterium]